MARSLTRTTFFAVMCIILVAGCKGTPTTPAPTTVPTAVTTKNVLQLYDEKANAEQDIASALALAKADKKYVLLDFGGNWCPDCIVLAKLYEAEPLKSFMEKNYHFVAVDVGYFDKNLNISARYGDPIKKGVPAVVVLDPSGKMVGSTGDGALESARNMSGQQVLDILKKWAPAQG